MFKNRLVLPGLVAGVTLTGVLVANAVTPNGSPPVRTVGLSTASIAGNVRVLPNDSLLPDLTLPTLTATGNTTTVKPTCTYYGPSSTGGWELWAQVQVSGATIPAGSVAVAPGNWLRTAAPNLTSVDTLPPCHDLPPFPLTDLPQVKQLNGDAQKQCQLQLAEDLANLNEDLGRLYRTLLLKALLEQSTLKAAFAVAGQQKKTDIGQLIRQSTLQPLDLFNALAQATQELDSASRDQATKMAGCTPNESKSSGEKSSVSKSSKDPQTPDELRQQAKTENWGAKDPRTFGQLIKDALGKLAKVFKGSFKRQTLAAIINDARLSQRNATIAAFEASQGFGSQGASVGGIAGTTAGNKTAVTAQNVVTRNAAGNLETDVEQSVDNALADPTVKGPKSLVLTPVKGGPNAQVLVVQPDGTVRLGQANVVVDGMTNTITVSDLVIS